MLLTILIQAQFSVLTWRLTTICNSSSRDLMSFSTRAHGTDIHAGSTPIHIFVNLEVPCTHYGFASAHPRIKFISMSHDQNYQESPMALTAG